MNLQLKTLSHRLSTCHRHPSKPVTGFCASCLRERLAGIDTDTQQESPVPNNHSSSELRRSKSYSAAKREAGIEQSEVQHRKSCDVRSGNSLSDLFCREDKPRCTIREVEIESENLGSELREVVANERLFRASEGIIGPALGTIDDFAGEEAEFKTVKEFIDLEFRRKKNAGRDLREIAGSVWEAASVFSKKLGKWRKKQKRKNLSNNGNVGTVKAEDIKPRVLEIRETRSEVGDYGLGRRSCDTDPRFSVDAGRMSLDDSRYSFDEPRASWDGYLIGKTYPRITPMVSVLEEAKFSGTGFEKDDPSDEAEGSPMNVGDKIPGGSAQTKDYYMDSLSSLRRRKSFDRSCSHRKGASGDFDDLKLISNAKVSPATTELFYGAKVLITEKDLNNSHSKATREGDLSGTDVTSKDSVPDAAVIDRKTFKKVHRWRKVLSVLGMIQKRSGESKSDDEESSVGGNVVDRPIAESWEKLRRVANGEANSCVSQKLIRSYSVSCRDPSKLAGFNGSNDSKLNVSRWRDDFTLQRNRSVRYSPNNFDNGLLRFYLTPLRSYSSRGKPGKSRPRNSPFNVKHVM
ncbi:protein OCTOPUS [Benincasa hispida]|uniref:protein OCTOPUS n=1 Tax=Benincasa hispida TaxID=102211 RepID=UPI001900A1CB|nr:protein OCTOPUS [Benincasa hispida]